MFISWAVVKTAVVDDLPDPEQILQIHEQIEEEYDLTYTGAAVAAPRLKLERLLDDVDEHDGVFVRAAALLRDLVTSHLFEDGNKRTAWAVTNLYLSDHDAEPAVSDERTVHFLKRIRRFDVHEIRDWLANGKVDEDRLHP